MQSTGRSTGPAGGQDGARTVEEARVADGARVAAPARIADETAMTDRARAADGAAMANGARVAGGAAIALLGLMLVAFNQRPAVASVPPVLHELGLGLTGQSILVTIPVFCFGVGAPAGPYLRRVFGQERAVFLLMAVLAAAMALRAVFLGWTLFPATIVAGLCIANLNVLMPAFVKQRFPHHPGPPTSAYLAAATIGPALAAGLTVPVLHAAGGSVGWALGVWAIPAVAALVAWSPQLRVARQRAGREPGAAGEGGRTSGSSTGPTQVSAPAKPIWRHALAWQVMVFLGVGSLVFYGPLSWLSQIYQSRGVDAAGAGYLLLLMSLSSMIGSTVTPLLMRRRADVRAGVVAVVAITTVGLVGLLVGPSGSAFLWVAILGWGQGAQFGLALLLIVIRAGDHHVAARLSAMSQCGGYLIAGLGPLLMGGLFSLTSGWVMPIVFLIVVNAFGLGLGYHAAKERVIAA